MDKKILLVEDEALIAMAEEYTLRAHGFEVVSVSTGEKAVAAALNDPDIKLVLMDIDLGGGMDGTECARRILASLDLPVVFLTNHYEKEIVEKTRGISNYGYILKNSGEFVLIESIRMALELFDAERRRGGEDECTYRMLFDSIRDSLLVADTRRNIIDCNPAFTDLFGYTLEEIAGKPTVTVYESPEEFVRMGKAIEEHRGGLSDFIFVVHYKKKDGTVFPGETNVFYLKDREGNIIGFIGLIRDITERQRMEESLRKNEENLRITLDSIGDAVISTDLQGRIVRMNQVAENLTGWDFISAKGRDVGDLFRIENTLTGEKLEDPVTMVLKTGTVIGLANHTTLVSRNGMRFQIADSAAPITNDTGEIEGVVMVFRDVSEEYKAARRLEESEEKYRDLVESSPVGIFRTDSRGRAVHANPAMAVLVGAPSPHEAVEYFQDVSDQLYVDKTRRKELLNLLEKNGSVNNFELEARRMDGEHRWFSVHARLGPKRPDGSFFIDGFTTDITERKRAEQALENALIEKERLMKELNHRVKNNLSLVASLIGLKESASDGDLDLSDLINQISAVGLMHEKLHASRDMTHTPLREYIRDLLATLFSSFSSAGVEVDIDIDDINVPSAAAVPLGLITNEIATNAVKYGFSGNGSPRFSVSFKKDAEVPGLCVYTLSNSGPPIPGNVDIETPGTLGLKLVSALTEQIGGTLKLEKSPHPVFTFQFPLPEEEQVRMNRSRQKGGTLAFEQIEMLKDQKARTTRTLYGSSLL